MMGVVFSQMNVSMFEKHTLEDNVFLQDTLLCICKLYFHIATHVIITSICYYYIQCYLLQIVKAI